jgi:hypothetical protein
MKLLSFLIFPILALATTVSFDTVYDNSAASLSTVACSNGLNGLLTRGFTTFGSLPNFPHVGAAAVVEGWNSQNCGTCWTITFQGANGQINSINVLAIDHTDDGFVLSQAAMDELTGGLSTELGRVDAQVVGVDAASCGLS